MSDAPDATLNDPAVSAAGAAVGELDLGYQVALDGFSGPLDLLLYLVRRAEVDIADIPVSTIADQFIELIQADPDLDLDVAGDFILMAATLLELKSRLVMPPEDAAAEGEAEADDEVIDPRSGLIRQLLAYRRFKEATQLLVTLEQQHEERAARRLHELIPEDPEELDGLDLANCDVGLLYEVWEQVLIRISGLGPRTVINDDVPLEHKITSLIDTLRSAREARLSWMFSQEHSRTGRIGVLLATLECARQRFIEALQHEQYGDVFLRYREEEERVRPSGEPPADPPEEPRRRRRRPPLVTWHAPERAAQPEQQELELDDLAEEEVVVETDEQRFLRELEETCAVESVLGRTVDIEASFAAFQLQRRLDAELAARPAAAPREEVSAGSSDAVGPAAEVPASGTAGAPAIEGIAQAEVDSPALADPIPAIPEPRSP
jgi:segregation and condensation protein A